MTALEASEILKKFFLHPDKNQVEYPDRYLDDDDDYDEEDDDGSEWGLGFDGAYDEYDESYSFAIFFVKDGSAVDKEEVFIYSVDKKK
jgi:hypothetical protein